MTLYDIHLLKGNFHRSLQEMGFVHSTKVQNKPYPLAHVSLLPSLFIWFLATICPQLYWKTLSLEQLPYRYQPNKPVSTAPKKDIVIMLPYLDLHSFQFTKRLK